MQERQQWRLEAVLEPGYTAHPTGRRQIYDDERRAQIELERLRGARHPADQILIRVKGDSQMLRQRLGTAND
jgi:phage repressor protein C with HTH and peptisase S24 domain